LCPFWCGVEPKREPKRAQRACPKSGDSDLESPFALEVYKERFIYLEKQVVPKKKTKMTFQSKQNIVDKIMEEESDWESDAEAQPQLEWWEEPLEEWEIAMLEKEKKFRNKDGAYRPGRVVNKRERVEEKEEEKEEKKRRVVEEEEEKEEEEEEEKEEEMAEESETEEEEESFFLRNKKATILVSDSQDEEEEEEEQEEEEQEEEEEEEEEDEEEEVIDLFSDEEEEDKKEDDEISMWVRVELDVMNKKMEDRKKNGEETYEEFMRKKKLGEEGLKKELMEKEKKMEEDVENEVKRRVRKQEVKDKSDILFYYKMPNTTAFKMEQQHLHWTSAMIQAFQDEEEGYFNSSQENWIVLDSQPEENMEEKMEESLRRGEQEEEEWEEDSQKGKKEFEESLLRTSLKMWMENHPLVKKQKRKPYKALKKQGKPYKAPK
jgi:hypothetical protein